MDEVIQRARAFLGRPDLAHRCFAVALLTLLVYLLEKEMHLVALLDDCWDVWWPVNGITLALLLVARRRHWPWILLATTVATELTQSWETDPVSKGVKIALCNWIEVLVPALMLPRFYTLDEWLQQPRLIWNFVRFAVLLGPALGGVLSGAYQYYEFHLAFWPSVVRWGVADGVGTLMYTPLVLVLISPETYSLFRWRELRFTLGPILLLVVTSWFIFHQNSYPIGFLVMPIVLLIAIRTGFSGSTLAINLLAPIATAATLHGTGPFALMVGANEPYRIITLQVFLTLALLMAFPISVARVQQQSIAAQLQSAYLQMASLATVDSLTGLANRRRFDAALETEWRRALRDGQPVAVLMVDADYFKAYNDCYGHPAGDACLQAITKGICDIPQRGGDLVARYGGEEFVVLLPGIDGDGAFDVAELVRSNVRLLDLPHEGSPSGRVTVSLGCAAMIPNENTHPAVLVEASDRALYAAKQSGRDRAYLYAAGTGAEMQLNVGDEKAFLLSTS